MVGVLTAVAVAAIEAQAALAAAVREATLATAVVVAVAVEETRLGEEHLDLAQLLLLETDHVELVPRLDLARGELLGHVDPQHGDALVRVRIRVRVKARVRVGVLGLELGLEFGLRC